MSPDRFSVEAPLAHEGLVRGLARSILHGDDRVEDVVQETFATSLTASPRDRGALGRWLGTISRRLALRVRRSDEAGTMTIRVDVRVRDGQRHLTRHLTLPLTFEGPDLPSTTWRR